MNNLNLLSQKSYFDSIVNKHLRSKDVPISSNESRSATTKQTEPKHNLNSTQKTLKPNARATNTRHSVNFDKDQISRTIENDTKETFRSNFGSATNQERRFNGTQPIQP
jgi:hypothetical protein